MTTIPRRSILKAAGAMGMVLLAPKLPLWAAGDRPPSSSAPDGFDDVSACLLGIDSSSLVPAVIPDNASLADLYYSVCDAAGGADYVTTLIGQYQSMVQQGMSAQDIAEALLTEDTYFRTDSTGTYSRLIMAMWLFGTWYGATEVSNNSAASNYISSDYQNNFIVSSRAYKNGWAWRIAQAHPMGFSQFSLGSWADDPPSLSDYGISLTS